MGAENQSWVLCESNRCSYPLSSSLQNQLLKNNISTSKCPCVWCMTCVDPCGNQRETTVFSVLVQLMPLKPGLSLNLELLGPWPQPPPGVWVTAAGTETPSFLLLVLFIYFCFFETRSHCVAQADPKLTEILQLLPSRPGIKGMGHHT